ncbi:MAG: hypothetical protein LW807_06255 [Proteobacteria bacterium]|jgi:hypothetical protein|nr:hypothetical protein [Pseudomonadota bacterium]
MSDLIDISDVQTYPKELLNFLENNYALFLDYCDAEHYFMQLSEECVSFGCCEYSNRFTDACIMRFQSINKILFDRSFMYVHYTRLLDVEIQNVKVEGLKILTLQLINNKLKYISENGILDTETINNLRREADKSFGDNAFLYAGKRQDMVWVTTLKDSCSNYNGIIHLLNNWGGENIYKWERDSNLLKSIGYPAIIMVKFMFHELDSLMRFRHNIAYGVVKAYVKSYFNKSFEWSVCNWSNQEVYFPSNVNEFYIKTNIDVNNIVGVYKLGDDAFSSMINNKIIQDLCEPKII